MLIKSSEKHYDRYDYIIEKRETTLKWEKALQVPLSNDGLNEINLIIEKKKEFTRHLSNEFQLNWL